MSAHERLACLYAETHPDAAARIAEGAPAEAFGRFLQSLPESVSAGVVSHASPLLAAEALEKTEAFAAARIFGKLDPGAAAALLRRFSTPARRRVLDALPKPARAELEQLTHYEPEQVGSRLDPRAPAVPAEASVGDALERVRQSPAGALYYVYVIDAGHQLVGVANMRELMLAEPKSRIETIMAKNPDRLRADESLEAVVVHPAWQRVHALPVVDATERFLGALRYSAFRLIEAERGKSRSGPSATRTASALAELFWLGASAVARLAETTALGRTDTERP